MAAKRSYRRKAKISVEAQVEQGMQRAMGASANGGGGGSAVAVEEAPPVEAPQVTPRRRGRPKKQRPLMKHERFLGIQTKILSMVSDLSGAGFADSFVIPGPIKPIHVPVQDRVTGAMVAHVEEPLGTYLMRVSIKDNYAQRQAYDHLRDPIYRRLIRDFILGGIIPESKIAALNSIVEANRAGSLNEDGLYFSIIDGLQRLYCFSTAVLLCSYGIELVREGLVTPDDWEYFGPPVDQAIAQAGSQQNLVQTLLNRPIRYEIFYNIDLTDLLNYLVTYNTGQRRMTLPNQLEIMQQPLVQELERRTGAKVYHSLSATPNDKRPKHTFLAADLILAAQAFLTSNPQVKAANQAEALLQQESFLEEGGDIKMALKFLESTVTKVQAKVMTAYAGDTYKEEILTSGGGSVTGDVSKVGRSFAPE